MPSTGPDWDGAVVKDNVVYPIGKSINYPPPFIRKEKFELSKEASAFQSHVQNQLDKKKRSNRFHRKVEHK